MSAAAQPATYVSLTDKVRSILDKTHDALTPDDKDLFLSFLNPSPQSSVRLKSLLERPSTSFTAADRADWLAFRACLAVKLAGCEKAAKGLQQAIVNTGYLFQSA